MTPRLIRAATRSLLLNRRTWHRAVRTEYAAIPCPGFEALAAPLAVIEKLARVDRHLFARLVTARRTGDRRCQKHGAYVLRKASAGSIRIARHAGSRAPKMQRTKAAPTTGTISMPTGLNEIRRPMTGI